MQAKAKDAGKLKEEIEQFVKHNKSAFKHKPYPVQPFAWVWPIARSPLSRRTDALIAINNGRGFVLQAAVPVFTESYTLRTDAYNTMKIDYIVPIAKHGPFDDQSLLDVVLGGCVCASFLSLLRTYTQTLLTHSCDKCSQRQRQKGVGAG